MSSRLQFEKPNPYSNKVLIGGWFYERYIPEIPPDPARHNTTYKESYDLKPPTKNDPAIVWNQKLNAENSNFISQLGRNDFPSYFDNFSSTYDLSYNHFPKCYKNYIPRKLRFRLGYHEPDQDYIPTFGNLTKYGLVDYKKWQWDCEKGDPRKTYSTSYRDDFIGPELKDYAKSSERKSTPKPNSTQLLESNVINANIKFRDQQVRNICPNEDLVKKPPEPHFDPITWECKYGKIECDQCKKCT